jgi:hypothetical protein
LPSRLRAIARSTMPFTFAAIRASRGPSSHVRESCTTTIRRPEASPRARKTFRTLGRQNLFALAFRTNNMKTPAGRARKIAALVAMLERGETIVPERRR